MPFIAIASNAPDLGEEVARRVAKELDLPLVRDDLLERAATEHDTTVSHLRRALQGERSVLNGFAHDYEKSLVYVTSALAGILTEDPCVYYGRATYLLPDDIGHVLRVGLVAAPELCIEGTMKAEKVGRAQAEALVANRKQAQERWVREQRFTDPWNATLFDLRVSLPETSTDDAVKLISETASGDILRTTDRSIKSALDFLLAVRVNRALIRHGHYNARVSAQQGRVTVKLVHRPAPRGAFLRSIHALRQERQVERVKPICRAVGGVVDVEVRLASPTVKPKTLLVGTAADFSTKLSKNLERRDIPADVVYEGDRVLAALESETPEVMILDLKMPGIDGLEVLRRVKATHPDIEVIVVTGHGSDEDERRARELGAFDYLHKPVDVDVLAKRIEAASHH